MKRSSFALALLLAACSNAAVPVEEPAPTPPPTTGDEVADVAPENGRLPADVRPTRYALTLAIDPTRERYTGVVEIDVELPRRQRTIYLHGEALDVTTVTVEAEDGEPREATWESIDEEGLARVTVARPVGPGRVRLNLQYGAAFETTNRALFRVAVGDDHYIYSQMEPLDARRSFPCFDEPRFKTPYDVTLVIREGDVAVANARELSSTPASGGTRRVRFATTQAIPSYLVAIAVGPFDRVEGDPIPPNDVRSAPLALGAVAPRGQGPQLAHAMRHTGAILTWLETYFGIAYPFDKLDLIAVPSFGGAMENPGAVTFGDRLLLLGEDPPIGQQRGYAFVMAHELAHMWFGDLVTMQWWDDLWLNEAFASWMEAQTIQGTFPEFEPSAGAMGEAIDAMDADSLGSARQIRQPITSTHDIQNAFDEITYLKGQSVLAMLERWMTPEVFRRGVQAYLRAHARGNATGEDLLDALSEAAGRDVRGPANSFIAQPGVPLVEVTPECADGAGSLTLRQTRYLPLGSEAEAGARWQIPFCARYAAGGEVRQACTLLTEEQGSLPLEGGCADWVMPNAGGVGYYRWTLPPQALETLRQRGLAQLDVREAMSFADSVRSGLAAGRITYDVAMNALRPLAQRSERPLATAPIGLTQMAIDDLLDEAGQARARTWAGRVYRAPWRRLGWRVRPGDDPDTQLLRQELAIFMALGVRDRTVRREAAALGRAYLGLGGDRAIHPDAVAPDLASLCVAVAVEEGGAEVFEHVLAQLLAATDPVVRRNLLGGIARGTTDPALRERLFALTADADGGLRMNEIFAPFREQAQTPAGRDAAWAWLQAHYAELSARLGPHVSGYLPYAASGQCTDGAAEEARAFFAPRMEATQGGPRNLAKVVEGIQICAASADHARDSARAFFAR
ncbi:MAG: M1 family metallopeptidase [Sandaracinaceae bacterium]|nr:M1 family metallopeptidase [Sandaracinaceae bacterium]